MQADTVLDAKRADVEEHKSGAVILNLDIQLTYNSMPNLNTWTENEVKSATMNEE